MLDKYVIKQCYIGMIYFAMTWSILEIALKPVVAWEWLQTISHLHDKKRIIKMHF